jgi:hypothetical protein
MDALNRPRAHAARARAADTTRNSTSNDAILSANVSGAVAPRAPFACTAYSPLLRFHSKPKSEVEKQRFSIEIQQPLF